MVDHDKSVSDSVHNSVKHGSESSHEDLLQFYVGKLRAVVTIAACLAYHFDRLRSSIDNSFWVFTLRISKHKLGCDDDLQDVNKLLTCNVLQPCLES